MHHSHLNVSNNNRLGICESLSTGTFSFTLSFTLVLVEAFFNPTSHAVHQVDDPRAGRAAGALSANPLVP